MLPTVHYNMGGIPTNHFGEVLRPTDADPDAVVPGLFAAGEAGCASVHGANRLGANSLLDIVVFGRACANRIAEVAKPGDALKAAARRTRATATIANLDAAPLLEGPKSTAEMRAELQKAMQTHAAVFREQDKLEEGCKKVDDVCKSFADVGHHRPLDGVEHRPRRDARAAEPARAGRADGVLGGGAQGEPRRARARRLPVA